MKPKAIAVVGIKKSGKTTTIEKLTQELTKRGYKVAVIKHISESGFTIDTVGKDTWKFAQAGAKTIITAAANETATIEKIPLEKISLKTLLKKCAGSQIVLIEGLKRQVARDKKIPKIVVAITKQEATSAVENYTPILAFSGPYATHVLSAKIPYVDAEKNPEKLANIIENRLFK